MSAIRDELICETSGTSFLSPDDGVVMKRPPKRKSESETGLLKGPFPKKPKLSPPECAIVASEKGIQSAAEDHDDQLRNTTQSGVKDTVSEGDVCTLSPETATDKMITYERSGGQSSKTVTDTESWPFSPIESEGTQTCPDEEGGTRTGSGVWEDNPVTSEERGSVEVELRRMSLEKSSPLGNNTTAICPSPVKSAVTICDGEVPLNVRYVDYGEPNEELFKSQHSCSELSPPSPQFEFIGACHKSSAQEKNDEDYNKKLSCFLFNNTQNRSELAPSDDHLYTEGLSIPAPPALYSPPSYGANRRQSPLHEVGSKHEVESTGGKSSNMNRMDFAHDNVKDDDLNTDENQFLAIVTPNKDVIPEFGTSVKKRRKRGYQRCRTTSGSIEPLKIDTSMCKESKSSGYCVIL